MLSLGLFQREVRTNFFPVPIATEVRERPESLPVSFPLSSFTAAPCHSTESLLERLDVTGGLPCGKLITFVHKIGLADERSCYTGWNHTHVKNTLHFSKLDFDRTIPDIMFCLSIKEDMTWMVSSCGVEITSGSFIDSLPLKLDTVLQVISVPTRLNHCHICFKIFREIPDF